MSTEGEVPKWIFEALGVLAAIFGFGKAWGSLVQKDQAQEKRIRKLEQDLTDAIAARDIDIKELKSLFVNENNEPRFITYPAHDKMQANCQAIIKNELAHIKETCDEIKQVINQRRSESRRGDAQD